MTTPTPEQIEAALDRPMHGEYHLLLPKHVETLRTAIASLQAEVERQHAVILQAHCYLTKRAPDTALVVLSDALAPLPEQPAAPEPQECPECFGEKRVYIAGYKVNCPTCKGKGVK